MEDFFDKFYMKISDVAKLLGVSSRTLQLKCQKGKYFYRQIEGNGGLRYEILLSSLEPKYINILKAKGYFSDVQRVKGSITPCNTGQHVINDTAENRLTDNNTCQPVSLEQTQVCFNMETPKGQKSVLSDSTTDLPHFLPCEQNNKFVFDVVSYQGAISPKRNILQSPVFFQKTEQQTSDNEIATLKDIFSAVGVQAENRKIIIPEVQKKKALAKVDLIIAWEKFRIGKQKKKADKNFIKAYNSDLMYKTLHKILGQVSYKTLYRWRSDYHKSNDNWKALVDSYNYCGECQLNTMLADIEKTLLIKYMMHQNKYSLGRAYELICNELRTVNNIEPSSYSAYRRVWEWICKNHAEKVAFARGGKKYLLDTQAPYIKRDWTKLNVGDMIVGDGHTLDFMIKNPFTGKPSRATLIGFMDVASRDLVGYDIMLTENTQVIASALRNAIIYLGKIPKAVQLDNGRAFKGKYFTSCKDFNEDGFNGLYKTLGIQTYFSRAYNGRAKIIERFFEELTESHAKQWGSYIGNTIFNKPAYTMRNEKFHKSLQGGDCPTIEDVKIALEWWLNNIYRKRPCQNDKNMSIKEYFEKGKGEGIEIDNLDDLMMATSEARKIGRNGIKIFDNYYWNDILFGLNCKAVVKYNLFDLSYVKLYRQSGEFICKAERQAEVHPAAKLFGTPKDYAEFLAQNKAKQKLINDRIKPLKDGLKILYGNNNKSTQEIEKIAEQNNKRMEIEEKTYKITYAEKFLNLKVGEDDEYKIDYSKYNVL